MKSVDKKGVPAFWYIGSVQRSCGVHDEVDEDRTRAIEVVAVMRGRHVVEAEVHCPSLQQAGTSRADAATLHPFFDAC
jgi:hypothetical protein